MKTHLLIGTAVAIALGSMALAAERETSFSPTTIEFEGRRWAHDATGRFAVEEYRGKTALRLCGGYDASICLPDVEFKDGVIEVDLAALSRSTPGIGFRGRDNGKWCNRVTFNHWLRKGQVADILEQAVVTRKNGTVLVLNLRGPGPDGSRESWDGPGWFHAKVVVLGDTVKVYLNGSEEPAIELGAVFDKDRKGMLGLCGGGGGGFYFANFRYVTVE